MTELLTDGPRIAAFARRYVRHTKGRWAGQPLTFEPWQQEFLDEAFSVGPDGLRVYREVLLGIPRKNGKSTMASAIALYLLTSDGENEPEVYAAAAAKNQASIVFRQARRFVDASPGLLDFVRPRQYHIDCPQNGGIFRVLSSDAALQHGLNPHGNIIDELHAHKSDALYTALTSGGGAREQPITVTITTSGMSEEQVLGVIYRAALEMPDIETRPGLTIVRSPDSRFLMYWYGAEPDADPDDPAVWARANPASWITTDYLRTERRKPTMRLADFQRWHLNQWPAGTEAWLPQGAWSACSTKDHDPSNRLHGLDPKRPIAVGIDFGVADDTTCVAVAQRIPMPLGRRNPEVVSSLDRVVIRTRFFVPDPDSGEEADVGAILDYLRSLRVRFPELARRVPDRRGAAGPIYAYDPWGFKALAQILEGEGLVMVDVPQNDSRMVPASTELYGLVVEGRLEHDGDPLLARHIANVVGKNRGESGWRITKLKDSTRKIDGAVATAMATHEALQPWPAPRAKAFVA